MNANKDEAEKCLQMALLALREGDFERATKLRDKAKKLYPEFEARFNAKFENVTKRKPTTSSVKCEVQNAENHEDTPPGRPTSRKPNEATESKKHIKRVQKCDNYYEILNVNQNATEDEIKKSYRKLALGLHPDKNKQPGADEAFKALQQAYETLTNAKRRKTYDIMLNQNLLNGPTTEPIYFDSVVLGWTIFGIASIIGGAFLVNWLSKKLSNNDKKRLN